MHSSTRLIEKDRLSNKFNRRDVAYFDLYKDRMPQEEWAMFSCNQIGYPFSVADMNLAQHYGDLAYTDFNEVFKTKGENVRQ